MSIWWPLGPFIVKSTTDAASTTVSQFSQETFPEMINQSCVAIMKAAATLA
ncbi:hypothetical protein Q9G87_59950 [Nonomuraea sp. G32]|nr:hypothetical protein [Nonomuraea sp. G32]MDP4512090.1 hypothetical protein [Nonomuraea sp. G32]